MGILAFGLALGGLLNFTRTVTAYEKPAGIGSADAIVVLTGGSARIDHALALVAGKKGKRLLISGVNPKTSNAALRRVNESSLMLFNCCVDVGRKATDTIGNAAETKDWIEEYGFDRLILVTSDYHMPRSLLEFRRRMPDKVFIPYPIPLQDLREEDWYRKPENVRLILSEYGKYLGAQAKGYLDFEPLRSVNAALRGT